METVRALHKDQGAVLLELPEYHARALIRVLENRISLEEAVLRGGPFSRLLSNYMSSIFLEWRVRLFHHRLLPIVRYVAGTDGSPGWEKAANGNYVFGFLQMRRAAL
jgi:hypothetical protein